MLKKSRLIRILALGISVFIVGACAGQQYISPRQKQGESLLAERKFDAAIQAFQQAVREAEKGGDPRELAHLKSLLGWAYGEAMQLEEGAKEIKDAIRIAEDNGADAALFHARLAVIRSKAIDSREGLVAADKALALTARKWQARSKAQERDRVIDYAVANHGLPPDVDMIKTVTMAESALAVLVLLQGDDPKAAAAGERAVGHFQSLMSLMKMARGGDADEFYRGMGVAAAAASRAYRNLGNGAKEEAFAKVGVEAFKRAGVEVKGGDLLAAYAESGGYLSVSRMAKGGPFRPDPRFSDDFNRAEKLYFEGRYKEAIPSYREAAQKAQKQGSPEEAARTLSQLGWLLAELGRYPEAMRLLRESIQSHPDADITPVTYARLGAVEGRLGNYEKGLDSANRALDLLVKKRQKMFAGKERDAVIDAAMKNPGLPPDVILLKAVTAAEGARTAIYYLRGDFQEAVKEGERAIRHFQDIAGAVALAPEREQISYYEGIGYTTLCVGDATRSLGQVRKGRELLERSREFFKKARLNFGDVIAEGLIAYSYINEGDDKKGGELFQRNLRRIETGDLTELKWHIRSVFAGELLKEGRRLEGTLRGIQAEKRSDELLKMKAEMLGANREKAAVLGLLLGADSGTRLGAILAGLEKAADKDSAAEGLQRLVRFFKEEAYKNTLGAIENIESIRSVLETDLNKRFFQANKQTIYRDLIELAVELYGAEAGFAALERAKARSLMDLLATREVSFRKGGALREQAAIREEVGEERLQARDQEIKGTPPPAAGEKAIERYRGVTLKLKGEEPELASMITASTLSDKEVRAFLPPDANLVEYYLSGEKIYIWLLGRDRISVDVIAQPAAGLKEKVGQFREAIVARDAGKEKTLSRELHDLLILPVKGKISGRRLTIVPHDFLHYLPFNALHSGEKYLIEEFPLSSAPSASVLQFALAKGRGAGTSLVAFGNPDLGDPAYDLPFAGREVEGLASLFPGARVYQRQAATRGAALREAGNFELIHFASHAEFSAIDPLFSSILLARDGGGSGRLSAQEIFGLELKARLVTLSACQTGLGRVTSGDEIIGMNRAFLYAGAPSILSSLWSVSDLSTASLMESFYRHGKGMAKDEALRKAQMELMRTEGMTRPFYWAPFYLTGDWR